MKIDKNELSRKIAQIKGIVPKTTTIEALQGVLLKDGYLIASNTEVTVKAKLESAEGTPFIIPAKPSYTEQWQMPNSIGCGGIKHSGTWTRIAEKVYILYVLNAQK